MLRAELSLSAEVIETAGWKENINRAVLLQEDYQVRGKSAGIQQEYILFSLN